MPVVVSKIRRVHTLISRKKNLSAREQFSLTCLVTSAIFGIFSCCPVFWGQITDYFSGNMAKEESDESWMRSCLRRNPRLRILPRLEAVAGWGGGGEDLEDVLEQEAHLEEVATKVTAEERKHKPQQ